MPIYEYVCRDCGVHFEKIQKVSDDPITVCPTCDGAVEKKVSLSGFQFKGDGWYLTDYSKKNAPTTKDSSKESTPKAETASKPAETKTSSE